MIQFFRGMTVMGFVVAGLFFLRFWYRTGDRLFVAFAAAFWLFALNDALVTLFAVGESQSVTYVVRFAGFALLILAILAKNVHRSGRG